MIDFARFLVGSAIQDVTAQMMGGSGPAAQREDKMTITLGFGDGSLATVHYLANGSSRFPKERVEVFSEGRILQLDNFRVLKGYQWPGFSSKRLARQDKGHQAEIKAFLDAIQSGSGELISWSELEEVSDASFSALEKARGIG